MRWDRASPFVTGGNWTMRMVKMVEIKARTMNAEEMNMAYVQ